MEVQHSHCKSLQRFKVKGLIYVYLKLANLVKLPIFSCHKATIAKVAFNAHFYPPLTSKESLFLRKPSFRRKTRKTPPFEYFFFKFHSS